MQNQDVDALIRVPGIGRKTARTACWSRCGIKPGARGRHTPRRAGAAVPQASSGGRSVRGAGRPSDTARPEATRLLKAAGPGTHSTEELIRRALQSAAQE